MLPCWPGAHNELTGQPTNGKEPLGIWCVFVGGAPMPKYSLRRVCGTGEKWRLPTSRCCLQSCAASTRGVKAAHSVRDSAGCSRPLPCGTHPPCSAHSHCCAQVRALPFETVSPFMVDGSILSPPLVPTRAGVGVFVIYLVPGRGSGLRGWTCGAPQSAE